VYSEDSSFTTVNGQKVSNTCSHVCWPNHPQPSERLPCGAALMRNVRTKNGGTAIQPFRIYPYQSLINGIQQLVLRDKFLKDVEHWRTRVVPPGFLCDVYEGAVWKELLAEGYLQSSYNLCLTINVDWFQPFVHTRKLHYKRFCLLYILFLTEYSVDAIYLVIQNLPHAIRFKKDNVILVGLIPGPKEPN